MERLQGHKHLIQGNHDRVKGKLRPYWESIEQYAEVNDENRLVILSHYPILFYKNQHYGAVMLYGHVHNLARKYTGMNTVRSSMRRASDRFTRRADSARVSSGRCATPKE